jgi:outer membrane protein OmpA-like peptidoglycan-associated protein
MMPLDAVNFEPGIETLAADGQRQVKHLAAVLSAYPESRVTIFGPTDPGVDPATSRDLGMNRAKTIALILNQLGIQSGRIATDVVETGAGAPVNAQVEVMNR